MAVVENNVLLRSTDSSGNTNLYYPITLKDNVDGLEEALATKQPAGDYATAGYIDTALAGINVIPECSTSDNGKILTVVNGTPTWKESAYKFQSITQDEYDALTEKDPSTLYIIGV